MALGVKHHKRNGSFAIKSFVGWARQRTKQDAEAWTCLKWAKLHPKLPALTISVMEIPN